MKPKPKNALEQELAYPSRREFIRRFGLATAGVGLGALAMPQAQANDLKGNLKMPESKEGKGTFCAKTCGKEIDAQIKLLSSEDFKVRKNATAELIAIGKAEGKKKELAKKQRELVIAKMELLKKAKDPEISQRAKTVIVALTPKPTPPRNDFPVHRGKIAIRR